MKERWRKDDSFTVCSMEYEGEGGGVVWCGELHVLTTHFSQVSLLLVPVYHHHHHTHTLIDHTTALRSVIT